MLDSVYAGLTGLSTFSKGLSNISNNVANLNTPGFKRTQTLFEDLFYNQQNLGGNGNNTSFTSGNGVDTAGTTVIFKQGELRQSGNDQDAAIDGNGLFILRDGDKTYYTRAGQFEFNSDGYLVAKATGGRVAVMSNTGTSLEDFNISDYRVNPPKITTLVKLSGNLSVNDVDNSHTISNVNAIDSNGQNQPLTLIFTNNSTVTPRSWLIEVKNQAGNVVANGEVRFQGDGSPLAGYEKFTFTYAPADASEQQITIDFGQPGTFSATTNFSSGTESTLSVQSTDGYAVGSLNKISYNDEGLIVLNYSNGQTANAKKLALAWFNFLPALNQQGGNLFVNDTDQLPIIGAAKSSVFGRISGGSIESSNVDLTQQFSDLIVTQRGYQASSQVVSAANEMMQQLLDLKGRR
ncbi:flagellar hook protein FlgE [Paucimonas lemoignei]|uniref:Flagellar basal-body rod protein FlgF n=1 Tax=Paucimonas lemoignei TaxID=29443 RepID=A0A4R3HX43_PAULE|nr:flagellar basal-body rod protein FlgF [Paucimonas lemoignei]TCS37728.1 flagellar hook protein FlgE [Paucimonas lemoignei]